MRKVCDFPVFRLAFVGFVAAFVFTANAGEPTSPLNRSPFGIAIAPDSSVAYVTDRTLGCLSILDLQNGDVIDEVTLQGMPQGLTLSADGTRLYVAERNPGIGVGTVAIVDTTSREVISRTPVGRWPTDVALADNESRLYVTNQDNHRLSIIDLTTDPAVLLDSVAAVREPYSLAISPDNQTVVVANLLPAGAGTDVGFAASVSLIRNTLPTHTTTHIKLPAGSSSLKGVCVSPDSKWAYLVHNFGRFNFNGPLSCWELV